jgi:hypothetical protein
MKTTQSLSKNIASDEPFKTMDIRAMRRLVPFQNHFLLKYAFNKVEEELGVSKGNKSRI